MLPAVKNTYNAQASMGMMPHSDECCCKDIKTAFTRKYKLPMKRLTPNLLNVKHAVGLFMGQRQPAKPLVKADVVFSSPPIRVCVVFCASLMPINTW